MYRKLVLGEKLTPVVYSEILRSLSDSGSINSSLPKGLSILMHRR